MEKSTGVEASIQVKPSYGLTDGEIASMIKDSMSYAEQDVQARMLAEQKVEAARVLESLVSALAADAALLSAAERQAIDDAAEQVRAQRQAMMPMQSKKRLKISTHKPRNLPHAVWINRSVSR
jgi:molecular chaperone HscA